MNNYCSKFPVIILSFKGAKQIDFSSSSLSLRRAISREYARHMNAVLDYPLHRERIKRILEAEGTNDDYLDSIQLLTDILHNFYNKKIIVIIDEYDVPLENAYYGGFYEQMLNFIRSLLESALKTNSSLQFGICFCKKACLVKTQ